MTLKQDRLRFNGRRQRGDEDECWLWQGGTLVSVGGVRMKPQRAAWVLAGKDIPPGQVIITTCGNKECTNPAHLACVPRSGVVPPLRKLSNRDICELGIIRRQGYTIRQLAELFRVSEGTVYRGLSRLEG